MPLAPLALIVLLAQPQTSSIDLNRRVYPLAAPIRSPKISIDSSEAPDLKAWGERAKNLATTWFPHLCQLLSTQGFKPPRSLLFKFRIKQDVPAYAAGNEISFHATYVRSHPEDLGMIIHELTHIVQAYPDNKTDVGWLVEGIADYTRWWRFEPEAPRTKIDFSKASYRDAYRTTAHWLAWVSFKYDLRLVPALDLNLRRAEDPIPTFSNLTGKSPDQLWEEFKAALAPKN